MFFDGSFWKQLRNGLHVKIQKYDINQLIDGGEVPSMRFEDMCLGIYKANEIYSQHININK